MSSEAAQKAYPDGMHSDGPALIEYVRRGFDAGAVAALRQAATGLQENTPEWEYLLALADEWEVGQ